MTAKYNNVILEPNPQSNKGYVMIKNKKSIVNGVPELPPMLNCIPTYSNSVPIRLNAFTVGYDSSSEYSKYNFHLRYSQDDGPIKDISWVGAGNDYDGVEAVLDILTKNVDGRIAFAINDTNISADDYGRDWISGISNDGMASYMSESDGVMNIDINNTLFVYSGSVNILDGIVEANSSIRASKLTIYPSAYSLLASTNGYLGNNADVDYYDYISGRLVISDSNTEYGIEYNDVGADTTPLVINSCLQVDAPVIIKCIPSYLNYSVEEPENYQGVAHGAYRINDGPIRTFNKEYVVDDEYGSRYSTAIRYFLDALSDDQVDVNTGSAIVKMDNVPILVVRSDYRWFEVRDDEDNYVGSYTIYPPFYVVEYADTPTIVGAPGRYADSFEYAEDETAYILDWHKAQTTKLEFVLSDGDGVDLVQEMFGGNATIHSCGIAGWYAS